MIGGIDTRRVINKVGVEQNASKRGFNAATLSHAEITALAHHFAAQFVAIYSQTVIGTISTIGMSFRCRFNIRTNTAIPQ